MGSGQEETERKTHQDWRLFASDNGILVGWWYFHQVSPYWLGLHQHHRCVLVVWTCLGFFAWPSRVCSRSQPHCALHRCNGHATWKLGSEISEIPVYHTAACQTWSLKLEAWRTAAAVPKSYFLYISASSFPRPLSQLVQLTLRIFHMVPSSGSDPVSRGQFEAQIILRVVELKCQYIWLIILISSSWEAEMHTAFLATLWHIRSTMHCRIVVFPNHAAHRVHYWWHSQDGSEASSFFWFDHKPVSEQDHIIPYRFRILCVGRVSSYYCNFNIDYWSDFVQIYSQV